MFQKNRISFCLFLSVCLLFSTFSLQVRAVAESDKKVIPPAVRKTPPAPVIKENERLTELATRRQKVAQKIGANGMLILFSTEPKIYTNDVDYEFRQENNLYYLTNLKQKNATLVLQPGNSQSPEILFLPRRDPRNETWNGYMYSPQDALKISGVREIWANSEFEPFVKALKEKQPYQPKPENILLRQKENSHASSSTNNEAFFKAAQEGSASLYLLNESDADKREFGQELKFVETWKSYVNGISVKDASSIFGDLRLRKSALELRYLQHAIDITTEAFGRAMGFVNQAKWEYEVEAEVEYTFKRRNADYWGYPSIVGCGLNATTLHYQESQGQIKKGDLLLMDVGAEYEHYTADVTRTFPVSGKFTPEQAAIYQIVYDAQEAAARATKPGNTINDLNKAATEVIKEGLFKYGLITDKNSQQYRIWFMHGTSHWLGMNVHDVGDYYSKFEPGMVFTNEPGIYIRPDALDYLPKTEANEKFIAAVRPAFEKYKNIGVRIEDDLLVTETGCEWMTKNLPRTITEIEGLIAKATKERREYASVIERSKFTNRKVTRESFINEITVDTFATILNRKSDTLFLRYH